MVIYRILIGAILFHILNLALSNAGSLSHGILWIYILPYGFMFIFLGQIARRTALELNSPVKISLGTNVLFILSLIFAAAIVQQYPNVNQFVASSIILLGIVSGLSEILWKAYNEKSIEKDSKSEHACKIVENPIQISPNLHIIP